MSRVTVLGVVAAMLVATNAQADAPELLEDPPDVATKAEARDPGYFHGIGTEGRSWEARSDTALGERRTFTQRFELAGALVLFTKLMPIVTRVSFGFADAIPTGMYIIQGPIISVGLRQRSNDARYWAELGLRLVPPYGGPHDLEPNAQKLALGSTLTSGIADDAAWLPFDKWGAQLYGGFQSRTKECGKNTTVLAGAEWGGRASLGSMSVNSWLGPQQAFIGNMHIEAFLIMRRFMAKPANVQLGAHGEVSLSSIWPGNAPLPMLGNFFVGWSPVYWFALRVFFGGATAGETGTQLQYGTRLQFFAP